ncbi:cytochrome P450 [Aspergillus varians]
MTASTVFIRTRSIGPIVRYAPGHIDVSDLDALQIIHKANKGYRNSDWSHSLAPPGGRDAHEHHQPHGPHPLASSAGWSLPRQISSETRARGCIQDDHALSRMEEELEQRGCIDVLKWWIYMALDVIIELRYGASVNILEDGEENRYMIDYLEGLRPLYATIKAYKRLLAEESPMPTLFTPLFDKGDKGFTYTQITHLAGSNITAGSHTTTTVRTLTIWAICKRPKVRDKLVKEVSQLPEGFKHNDVRNLPYLNCVIQESVRLYAAVPSVLPRAVPQGGVDINGYFIHEGTTTSTQCHSLHWREDYFLNALQFDPERWVSPTKEMEEAYMGFGASTRSCVGTNLAHTELRLRVAHFFRNFPRTTASSKEGMNDDEMRHRAWGFMSLVGHRRLFDA